jgi:predicted dinucleotide-binding enzyme
MSTGKLKIGILGTGNVGQALGAGFVSLGHEVMMGSRDAKNDKMREWVLKTGAGAKGGTFAEAAAFGDLLVLATLWSATEAILDAAGRASFSGKVVFDVTNPLRFEPNAPPALAVGHTDSGGEVVQRWLPDAKVVKVYNSVGNAHMVRPDFPGGPPDMFLCGNDAGAKKTTSEIVKAFGWNPVDVGGIELSRALEPLCILWVTYGMKTGSWSHAFKLLRK